MSFEEMIVSITKVAGAVGGFVLVVVNLKKVFKVLYNLFVTLPESIKYIEQEFKPNGGSSLKDAIKRIENRQIIQEQRLLFILDSNPDVGVFETDELGNCTRVSLTYCHMLNKTQDECTGMGWTTALYPEDKEKVFVEWSNAIKFNRPFDMKYRFMRANGAPFEVHGKANPIFAKDGKILAWLGMVKLVY